MEHHVQYTNWGELAISHQSVLGDRLGIGQQMVNNCIVHHLFHLGFIPLSPSYYNYILKLLLVLLVLFLRFTFFSLNQLFLSQPWVLPFTDSPPHPTREGGVEVNKWLHGTSFLPGVKPQHSMFSKLTIAVVKSLKKNIYMYIYINIYQQLFKAQIFCKKNKSKFIS